MSTPLTSVGPYRIERELGRGGMGVVYLALDPRLGRSVAIKALPDHLAGDSDRLARLEREARTLASLSHPGIAGIHGLEETGGRRYLVLEYVEGETLDARLARGPLPLDDALNIAGRIAEALDAAHEKGVVHRDLKPGNVMVTPDGAEKVLDFGLARVADPRQAGDAAPEAATLSAPGHLPSPTAPGLIMGTAGYMSPEQARGRPVDKRSDIWSFGVVLYEMLTGTSPFAGETASDSIGAVLHKDVDFARLPPETPAGVRRALARCLRRDRGERWRDIGDTLLELRASSGVEAGDARRVGAGVPMRAGLLMAIAFALGGALAVPVYRSMTGSAAVAPAPVERLEIGLSSETKSLVASPAISPNGRAVSYVLDGRLWIRQIDSFAPVSVEGGEGAVLSIWSPDSAHLAFARGAELWRVDATGRRSQLIGPSPNRIGNVGSGVWLPDGRIVFTTGNGGIFEIPAAGGGWKEIIPPPPGAMDIHEITTLPGGALLVTVHSSAGPWRLAVWDGGSLRTLDALGGRGYGVSHPAYAPSGHIVYQQRGANGGIWAAPFSLASLDVSGPPFKIASDGQSPCVDAHGTLVYARVDATSYVLTWVDPVTGDSSPFNPRGRESLSSPSFSADGSTVVYVRTDLPGRDIWLESLKTGSRVRVTNSKEEDWFPTLSPDGLRVATVEERFDPPGWRLRFHATDGSGPVGESIDVHDRISFDRRWSAVVFERESESTGVDIWSWDMTPGREPRPVITDPGAQAAPALSPDGSWLAFVERGDQTSRVVVLTRFPDAVGRWQISENYGAEIKWTPDGAGIAYVAIDGSIEVVDVKLKGTVQIGRPRRLVAGEASGVNAWLGFAIHPVNGRVLVPRLPSTGLGRQSIAIVKNWAREYAK